MDDQRVISEQTKVVGWLDALGVTEDQLRGAVEDGMKHVFACTAHDPHVLLGILGWGKVHRYLRDRLVPLGWKPYDDEDNYSSVVHPDGEISIGVSSGDDGVGDASAEMTNRSPKGKATRKVVNRNLRSFAEVDPDFARFVTPQTPPMPMSQTWLLVHYVDDDADEIRVELSLPLSINPSGYVSEWHTRLILTPIPIGRRDGSLLDGDAADDQVEDEIIVRPRDVG